MKKRILEFYSGLAVLAVCIFFMIYFYTVVSDMFFQKRYNIIAKFANSAGLEKGSQVRLNGVVVGIVDAIMLDQTYNVLISLKIDQAVELPSDSKFRIADRSLLGGREVKIELGGNKDYMKDGASTTNTIEYKSLEDIIGRVLNKSM